MDLSIALNTVEHREPASPPANPEVVPGATHWTSAPDRYRLDLQALRGIAILLVVLHHSGLPLLRAGYLGVDMFFTISGYLITGIISSAIQRGDFSFAAFYARRAKRLLPAAYVTFAATILLSVVFLEPRELIDFSRQVYGAVTFTANIALWQQTGYFESASNLKPLLHVWSLSLEEQYYLIVPALLFFVPRRAWKPGTVFVILASFGLCLAFADSRPGASFYLLPTRAWELALGSLGALVHTQRLSSSARRLFWPALAVLLLVPLVPFGGPHPGADAAAICISTLVVILAEHPSLNRGTPAAALARVGDISYSLYLVHWPLFAFANNAYLGTPPRSVSAALGLLAFALGYLLFRYVEKPMRRATILRPRFAVAAGLAASCLLMILAFQVAKRASADDVPLLAGAPNLGLGEECRFERRFVAKETCQSHPSPTTMVLGDSFAIHLVPGLAATSAGGVLQATKPSCAPFFFAAAVTTNGIKQARDCMEFNRSVLQYLGSTPSVSTVVLSSPFDYFLASTSFVGPDGQVAPARDDAISGAVENMTATVKALRSAGKRVVVVAPPPSAGFDVRLCHSRLASDKPILGAPADCSIPTGDYHAHRREVLEFLARLRREADVEVVSLDPLLCTPVSCSTRLEGTVLYRDEGHLSIGGSKLIAKRMDLATLLERAAR